MNLELKSALANCHIAKGEPVDFAMIFVEAAAELKKQFPRFAKQLAATGMLAVQVNPKEELLDWLQPQRE